NANPNVVRVRPHKRSGANLKRRTSAQCVSANPNVVRVQAGIQSSERLIQILPIGIRTLN
ncbi:MAG: hypothetical protein WCF58_01600, partial [Syntrophobacteraceae bacterium]